MNLWLVICMKQTTGKSAELHGTGVTKLHTAVGGDNSGEIRWIKDCLM